MKTLVLYRTMMKQTLIGLRRYLFETLSGTLTLFLFFLALFYGAKALAGARFNIGETRDAFVVGYAVWSLAIFAYFSMAQDLIQEAQLGTLEQLAMSPLGLGKVLLGRAISGLIWQLIIISLLLTAMMASSGQWLHIDIVSILPLTILTLGGVIGLSFAMGGLAIVFKRVQAALQLVQIAFIAFVAAPIHKFPWVKFMPLSWGNELLKRVMHDGDSLVTLGPSDVGFLVGHAAFYLSAGLLTFKYLERVARTRGLLGHY